MSHNVKFRYKYSGNGWGSGHLCVGSNKFEFVCSYVLNDPLEDLLSAVYQIIPNLAPFPRRKIDFIMWEEPTEYKWEFHVINEKNVAINIYEQDSDVETEMVFKDNFHPDDLLKALVHCIDRDAELRSSENIDRIYKQFKLYLKSP